MKEPIRSSWFDLYSQALPDVPFADFSRTSVSDSGMAGSRIPPCIFLVKLQRLQS